MRRLLVGSVSALLLLMPLASSASAESVTRTDPSGDVRYCDYSDESDEDPTDNCVVASRPTVDLTGFKVAYGTARIQVVLQYAELEPRGTSRFYAGAALQYRLPNGSREYVDLAVETTPGNRAGTSGVKFAIQDRTCSTRHLVDYERNRVTVTVASACLRDPRYVLASVGTYAVTSDFTRGYVDSAPGAFDSDATVRVDRR